MVTETIKKDMLPVKRVPPGELWHYTTLDVLECFLKGEIAFSHYKFMNDEAELSYACLCRYYNIVRYSSKGTTSS